MKKIKNKKTKSTFKSYSAILILASILIFFNLITIIYLSKYGFNFNYESETSENSVYNPIISSSDFSTVVNNKYFTLTPRTKFVYKGETKEGLEKIEVYFTEETRKVMGVDTVVVWDRVWLDGNLIEDTKDWYAQDKKGNVWYFGEESKEIVLGEVISTDGSWESGIDNAKPGIIMKANSKIGDVYRQEYYKGEAEDMGEIISLNETISVPFGNFKNCLKTKDSSRLELGSDEYKYYCPEIGNVVLELVIKDGEQVKLVSVEKNTEPTPSENIKDKEGNGLSEEEAKKIALKEVSGKITDISVELKFGKKAYVVEIEDSGVETDVIIDFYTGEVLGVES